jgi:hypothetical protein
MEGQRLLRREQIVLNSRPAHLYDTQANLLRRQLIFLSTRVGVEGKPRKYPVCVVYGEIQRELLVQFTRVGVEGKPS